MSASCCHEKAAKEERGDYYQEFGRVQGSHPCEHLREFGMLGSRLVLLATITPRERKPGVTIQ